MKTFDLKKILSPVANIVRRLKDRRAVLMDEITALDDTLHRFNGKAGRKRKASGGDTPSDDMAETPKRKGKRTRRDRAEIEADVAKIVEFIKASGTNGVGAKDIKAKFTISAPSVKSYLKQYAPKGTFKTTGAKSKMRYFG